jgi:hypothetical protein
MGMTNGLAMNQGFDGRDRQFLAIFVSQQSNLLAFSTPLQSVATLLQNSVAPMDRTHCGMKVLFRRSLIMSVEEEEPIKSRREFL